MVCQHAIALDRATGAVRWEHNGSCSGGGDSNAALHGGGSEAGYVAALSRSDGSVSWCAGTAGSPVLGATGNVDRPDAGMGAGGGHVLVPVDRYLVAYGAGGAAGEPSLTLRPGPEDVTVGRRVTLAAH